VEDELTCKELTEWITNYLEGCLPQAEHARLELHLSNCEGCQTYLAQMRLTVQSLGSKPRVEIPPALESELLQVFRSWRDRYQAH
jgi:anti-sigma factor RsiW